MTEFLERCGLRGWKAVWDPDDEAPRRGEVLPDKHVIIVRDREPKAAMQTTGHEISEELLRRLIADHRRVINGLITIIDELVRVRKEDTCDRIGDLFFQAFVDAPASDHLTHINPTRGANGLEEKQAHGDSGLEVGRDEKPTADVPCFPRSTGFTGKQRTHMRKAEELNR